jgi:RNA-directed DNA polymerase
VRPILSLRDFASRLGVPLERLSEIADNIEAHYKYQVLDQGKAKVRQLRVPDKELKLILRRVNRNILTKYSFGTAAHGGIRGRSPRTNATQHLGSRWVINLDVKEFFPNIRHYVVYRLFRRELGFGRDVARLLTRLTTLDSQLPQGSPTSTTIANLVLAGPVDGPVREVAARRGVRYTRFVDDVALSGNEPRDLINLVARTLSRRRLPMHRRKGKFQGEKLKIVSAAHRQEVTGLVVNSRNGPTVSKSKRDQVRAAIHGLVRIKPTCERDKALCSIRGRINHVAQFNPRAAYVLERYLRQTLSRATEPALANIQNSFSK